MSKAHPKTNVEHGRDCPAGLNTRDKTGERNRLAIGSGLSHDERGSIVILTAFLLPLMFFVIGMGIDYSNALRVRTTVATALDAALLAAARDMSIGTITESDVEDQVNTYFDANILGSNLANVSIDRITIIVDTDAGTISGDVAADVVTAFAGILQTDQITVNTDGQATYNLLNIELALVLDVTGSMGGQKLSDMKAAAKDLVDLLIPDENDNGGGLDKVRISVVPYSDLVNVGAYEEALTGFTSGESCVYERAGIHGSSDTGPIGPVAGFGPDDDGAVNTPPGGSGDRPQKAIVNDPRNFRGYVCGNPELMPLTGERQPLKNKIDSFGASGWTAGHIGIQWGWYTLSPNFNAVWPSSAQSRAYGAAQNLKVMVVMTDGSFNTWYEGGNGNSFNQGDALCDAIKDEDVEVYTVAFQAPGNAETFLRGCATGPNYYFETSTGTALRQAFEEIAKRLRALRLSS
jgi:Flp pilus assembly protein TadG